MDQASNQELAGMAGQANEMCKKATGFEATDWDMLFVRRRKQGFENGDLERNRLYSFENADRISRIYGLDAEDLRAIEAPVEIIMRHNPGWYPPVNDKGAMASKAMAFVLAEHAIPTGV